MNAYSKVPMACLAPLINGWLAIPGNTLKLLAERSGVPERRIYAIRRGYDKQRRGKREFRYTNVEFTTADELLMAMEKQDEWYLSLLDVYEAD